MNLRGACALAAAVVLVGCGGSAAASPTATPPPARPVAAAAGSQVWGMSEVTIIGSVRNWDDVLKLVAAVQAANPGVGQVTIVHYGLLRIESERWTWFVAWTGLTTA